MDDTKHVVVVLVQIFSRSFRFVISVVKRGYFLKCPPLFLV